MSRPHSLLFINLSTMLDRKPTTYKVVLLSCLLELHRFDDVLDAFEGGIVDFDKLFAVECFEDGGVFAFE